MRADVQSQAGTREWIGLAVLSLPTLLVSVDVSVILLALPHITATLGADSVQSLWIMDIYGFMLAGFMITMGTLGDRIGRRRLLMIGATAFGLASILAAFSTSATMLILARALLGIAGSTLAPSTLALLGNMFRDPKQRSFAIGLWMVSFMGGMLVGPLVGGTLLEHFWWGSIFLIGVPVMLLLLVTAPFLLPEFRDPDAGSIDLASVILSLGTILPVVYGLKELSKGGLQPLPLLMIAAGIAVGAAFVVRQRRLTVPFLDLGLFRNRTFRAAVAGMFGITVTGAVMLFITQYLQLVLGYSPLNAGLLMLPGVLASAIGFVLSPLVARRIRPANLITAGLAVSALGGLAFTQVEVASGLWVLVLGFTLFNLGSAPLVSLSTDLVVGSVPPQKTGSAAATSETSAELGFGMGIAVLGSIGTYVYRREMQGGSLPELPAQVAALARDTLAGAISSADGLAQPLAAALVQQAESAFVAGFHLVAFVTAAVIAGIALLAATQLRHLPPIGQPVDDAPSPPDIEPATTVAATTDISN